MCGPGPGPQAAGVQLQALPPDPGADQRGRPWMADRGQEHRAGGGVGPGAAYRGDKGMAVRPVKHDGEREPLAGLGQCHPVAALDRIERRHVERLRDGRPPRVVGVQQIAVPLVVGVVHLGDHAGEAAVRPVAPVDGQRVEDVAKHPGVGQHDDPAAVQVDAATGQIAVDVGADAAERIAEVVAGAETGQRPQPRRQPGQVVQVDQPLVAAIAEGVAQRGGADMADPALIECRGTGYHRPPSDSAAATPDRQPSSWKPQPW